MRKFRAVPTVEMLRVTWEKTSNPYVCPGHRFLSMYAATHDDHAVQIRFLTHIPRISIRRKVLLPRPKLSSYQRPITAHVFFALPEKQLSRSTDHEREALSCGTLNEKGASVDIRTSATALGGFERLKLGHQAADSSEHQAKQWLPIADRVVD